MIDVVPSIARYCLSWHGGHPSDRNHITEVPGNSGRFAPCFSARPDCLVQSGVIPWNQAATKNKMEPVQTDLQICCLPICAFHL